MNRIILTVLLAGLVAVGTGCGKKEADKPAEKVVNVTIAAAIKKDLPVVESAMGSTTSLSVAQALDPNSVRRGAFTIRLPFPEHVARQLRIGQSVRLSSFDDEKKVVTAHIKEIRPALNSSTQTMEVIAALPAGQAWYSVGSVRGEVVVNVHRGAIVVPEQAVVLRPAGAVVYVPQDGIVREYPVQPGTQRDGEIELLTGLKAGEVVVVDGAGMLSDGAKIKVRDTGEAGGSATGAGGDGRHGVVDLAHTGGGASGLFTGRRGARSPSDKYPTLAPASRGARALAEEKTMTHVLPQLLLAVLLSGASVAQAENLLDIYHLAQQNDLTLVQAQADYQANLERGAQGAGQLLPSVALSAARFSVNQDIRLPAPPHANDYDSDAYILQLTQPLYRKSNFAAYAQGKAIAAQAEAELAIARGDMMLRSVQTYFDVLSAEDTLAFARTEKAAIEGQLHLAERNFAVGNATVVDVHEARARYDLAVAQEVSADNDFQVKREALAVLVNASPAKLAPLGPDLPLRHPEPRDVDHWNRTAQEKNPLILAQERAIKVTEEEIEKNRGGHYPTLDLVASHGYNKNSNIFSSATYEYTTNQVGVQLQVPLYAGGITQSRVREAEARRDQARAALGQSRRIVTRQIRESYLAISGGVARVQALGQAQASSKRALESTLIGYESGVRTGVDVLNAQRDLYRTQRDLSQARYAYLLSQLKLKSSAGTMNEDDLADIYGLLITAIP